MFTHVCSCRAQFWETTTSTANLQLLSTPRSRQLCHAGNTGNSCYISLFLSDSLSFSLSLYIVCVSIQLLGCHVPLSLCSSLVLLLSAHLASFMLTPLLSPLMLTFDLSQLFSPIPSHLCPIPVSVCVFPASQS